MKDQWESLVTALDRVLVVATILTLVTVGLLPKFIYFEEGIYFKYFLEVSLVVLILNFVLLSLFYLKLYLPLINYFQEKLFVWRRKRLISLKKEIDDLLCELNKLDENQSGLPAYNLHLLKKNIEPVFKTGDVNLDNEEIVLLLRYLQDTKRYIISFIEEREKVLYNLEKSVTEEAYSLNSKIVIVINEIYFICDSAKTSKCVSDLLLGLRKLAQIAPSDSMIPASSIKDNRDISESLMALKETLADLEETLCLMENLIETEQRINDCSKTVDDCD